MYVRLYIHLKSIYCTFKSSITQLHVKSVWTIFILYYYGQSAPAVANILYINSGTAVLGHITIETILETAQSPLLTKTGR